MTWTRLLFAVVLIALLGSAASLWAHEPPAAEGPYRHRVVCRAVCGEVKR